MSIAIDAADGVVIAKSSKLDESPLVVQWDIQLVEMSQPPHGDG